MAQKRRLFVVVLAYNVLIGLPLGLLRQFHLAFFNPDLTGGFSQRLAMALQPAVFVAIILFSLLLSLLVQRRLRPLFDYFPGSGEYRSARSATVGVPWLLTAAHPLLWLLGTTAVYAFVYRWNAPGGVSYLWSLLVALGAGLVTGLYTALAVNRALLPVKRQLNMIALEEGERDRFIELQDQLILGSAVVVTGIMLLYAAGSIAGPGAPEQPTVALSLVVLVSLLLFSRMAALAGAQRKAQVDELVAALRALSEAGGDLRKRVRVVNFDETAKVSFAFNHFLDLLSHLLGTMQRSVERLFAVGSELTVTTEEIGEAVSSIAGSVEEIRGEMGKQNEAARGTMEAVREVADRIGSLDSLIEGEINVVHESSATIEEGLANVRSIGRNVGLVGEAFSSLVEQAADGKAKISTVNDQIEQLRARSEALEQANRLISTIAARTNLLAMNAAIEAAHAGDAGRGFAVVAEEIRNLAENAAGHSVTIRDELRATEGVIAEVTSASEAADASFQAVEKQVAQVDQLQSELSSAVEEQNQGNEQIFQALSQITETAENLRTSSSEMRGYTDDATKRMESLQELSRALSARISSIEERVTSIVGRIEAGRRKSEENRRIGEELQSVSDRFVLAEGEEEELLGEVDLEERSHAPRRSERTKP